MKCIRCGAPTLLGLLHGEGPIVCGPCRQDEIEKTKP